MHVSVYSAPFGVVPLELDEVYPLSQHETAHPFDLETVDFVAAQTAEYIKRQSYLGVVLLNDPRHWSDTIKKSVSKACKTKTIPFDWVDVDGVGSKKVFSHLENNLREQLREKT